MMTYAHAMPIAAQPVHAGSKCSVAHAPFQCLVFSTQADKCAPPKLAVTPLERSLDVASSADTEHYASIKSTLGEMMVPGGINSIPAPSMAPRPPSGLTFSGQYTAMSVAPSRKHATGSSSSRLGLRARMQSSQEARHWQ